MSTTISNFKYNGISIEIKPIIPVGTIVIYGGLSSTIPSKWHICDGSTFTTTSNLELYNIIGSRYNSGGEASGTFRIPNLVDKYILSTTSGVDSSNWSEGSNTMEVNQIPAHTHTFSSSTTNSVTPSLTARIYNTWVAGANGMWTGNDAANHPWISTWASQQGDLYIPVSGGNHTHTLYHSASSQGDSSESVSLGITNKKLYYIIKISV